MFKRVMVSLLLLLFIIPCAVNAASVDKISSSFRDSSVKIGNSTHLYLNVDINYSNEKDNTGLYMIMVRFDYKDDEVIISDISSPGFSSVILLDQETNDKYIVSIIDLSSTCFDGIFYCGDYRLDLDLFIKDSKKKSTDIVIKDIYLASTSYDLENQELSDEDISIFEKSYNKTLTLNILEGVVNTIPTTVATSKANINHKNPVQSVSTTKKNSSTKKTTTKKTSSSSKVSTSTTTANESPEEIKKNDIVANAFDDAKKYIEKLKEKDTQKKIIKGGLVVLGVIILLIIIVKLKNHKLNKKFKDF